MSYFLKDTVDFARHNEESRAVWSAFHQGKPTRVPVSVSGSIRVYLQNPELNTHGWSFQQFFEDLDVQIAAQVEYQKWRRFHVLCDHEMGMPADGWSVFVDLQNSLDAAWMGCPMIYLEDAVPDSEPILARRKEALYDLPQWTEDPTGMLARAMEFYEGMLDRAGKQEYDGLPLLPPYAAPGEGTDGPLDLAYKLRGADNLLVDMLTDEGYYHDLMSYITENLIRRMKRMREYRWSKRPDAPDKGQFRKDGFFFADDAIALISKAHYEEFVYPYHKRIFDEFSTGAPASMHLCGDATRHFKFLRDTFNVRLFDTGFPVDHGALRSELGPDVTLQGGPTIMQVKEGTQESITEEVRRICQSGVMQGGKFVMIAANNLAPCTPVENIQALYEATKTFGRY